MVNHVDMFKKFFVGLIQTLNWWVVGALLVVFVLLRIRKVGMFTWAMSWWVASYVTLTFGFRVGVPGSVVMIYMAIITGSILAYASSSRERWADFTRPVLDLVLKPSRRFLLALVVLAIPAAAAANVYMKMNVPVLAPQFGRTIHPAPPTEITVHDNTIDLVSGHNPYRHLEADDPEAFAAHVENGRRIYFENCFYCHGDAMAGDGMFAYGLNPIPTNFTDANNLPAFQETFIFWRVAKGAPGMPEEGGPWESAMPAWEDFLTEEEMWDVVLFLYDYTDFAPRENEEHH